MINEYPGVVGYFPQTLNMHVGTITGLEQYQQYQGGLGYPGNLQRAIQQMEAKPMVDGTKPVVVCGGCVEEAKDMEAAQALAEERAHQKGANAYILKPVKLIAPKRETVTTELA